MGGCVAKTFIVDNFQMIVLVVVLAVFIISISALLFYGPLKAK